MLYLLGSSFPFVLRVPYRTSCLMPSARAMSPNWSIFVLTGKALTRLLAIFPEVHQVERFIERAQQLGCASDAFPRGDNILLAID